MGTGSKEIRETNSLIWGLTAAPLLSRLVEALLAKVLVVLAVELAALVLVLVTGHAGHT